MKNRLSKLSEKLIEEFGNCCIAYGYESDNLSGEDLNKSKEELIQRVIELEKGYAENLIRH